MRFLRCASAGAVGAACVALAGLSGCSSDSNPAGPDPVPEVPPVIQSFLAVASDGRISHGEFTSLRWRVDGAETASIVPAIGQVSPPDAGSVSIRPHEPITYTLTVSNAFGSATATTTVEVDYPGGIWVSAREGDDSAAGANPQTAVQTLGEALQRAAGGVGVIFLSAGDYPTNVVIDNQQLEIYAGLNPDTFFPEPDSEGLFDSVLCPLSGTPVTIRNTTQSTLLSNLVIEAPSGADVALDVADAGTGSLRVRVVDCTVNGRDVASGTALRVTGNSSISVDRCRIWGARTIGGPAPVSTTRGLLLSGAVNATITNCFIDGGEGSTRSSGVEIGSTGTVGLGVNTISAEVPSSGQTSAAIRIVQGTPAIGGNILFTRGGAQRFGVLEESAEANPSFLEGNLFFRVGAVAYRNEPGEDAFTQDHLNDPNRTAEGSTVFGNLLEQGVSTNDMFRNVELGDYHLISPLPNFEPNPAVDRADESVRSPVYGAPAPPTRWLDIDGDLRPSVISRTDLGADET